MLVQHWVLTGIVPELHANVISVAALKWIYKATFQADSKQLQLTGEGEKAWEIPFAVSQDSVLRPLLF